METRKEAEQFLANSVVTGYDFLKNRSFYDALSDEKIIAMASKQDEYEFNYYNSTSYTSVLR